MNRVVSALVFITILSINAMAQNTSKVFWGLSFTPKSTIGLWENSEYTSGKAQLGLNIHSIAGYEISNQLSIISGVIYQLDRFKFLDYAIIFNEDISASGIDYYNSWTEYNQTIHYLGVPIQVRYDVNANPASLFFRIGYSYLFKLRESPSLAINESGLKRIDMPTNGIFEVNDQVSKVDVGIGKEIGFLSNASMILEAEVAYSLTPVFEYTILTTNELKAFDVGLKLGILFR